MSIGGFDQPMRYSQQRENKSKDKEVRIFMVCLEAITQILLRIKGLGDRPGHIICRAQCKKMQGSL